VAEEQPAERAGDEADRIGGEGQQRGGERLERREEEPREHEYGGRAVEEEVAPFKRGPDQAGKSGPQRSGWPASGTVKAAELDSGHGRSPIGSGGFWH
jgi:hypothetical protein